MYNTYQERQRDGPYEVLATLKMQGAKSHSKMEEDEENSKISRTIFLDKSSYQYYMSKKIDEILAEQILVLYGAMGTMIYRYNLSEFSKLLVNSAKKSVL
mgnify:CR=1 FL=1